MPSADKMPSPSSKHLSLLYTLTLTAWLALGYGAWSLLSLERTLHSVRAHGKELANQLSLTNAHLAAANERILKLEGSARGGRTRWRRQILDGLGGLGGPGENFMH